jgi:hypothetical protein
MTAYALSTALPAPMVLLAWAGVPFVAAGLALLGFGHTSRPSATATQERAA